MQKSLLMKASNTGFLNIASNSRNFSAGEKALKQRMNSIKGIGKVTKAMKMISSAKMKKDLGRLANGKSFGCDAIDMIFKSDQFLQRKMPAEVAEPRTLIIPITSDKGLCGAVNSSIIRLTKKMVARMNRAKLEIFPLGEKGSSAFARPFPDVMKQSITHIVTPFNYPSVMAVGVLVAQKSDDFDKIHVLYNHFLSAIAYEQRHIELMPRGRFLEAMQYGKLYDQTLPDGNTSNAALYELYLTSNLWVCLLQNAASEQSSRMQAMDNASKNATEMYEKLTLQYNKMRQARITTELCEIIAGATAL